MSISPELPDKVIEEILYPGVSQFRNGHETQILT